MSHTFLSSSRVTWRTRIRAKRILKALLPQVMAEKVLNKSNQRDYKWTQRLQWHPGAQGLHRHSFISRTQIKITPKEDKELLLFHWIFICISHNAQEIWPKDIHNMYTQELQNQDSLLASNIITQTKRYLRARLGLRKTT